MVEYVWPSGKDVLLTTLRWSGGVALGAVVALCVAGFEALLRVALRYVRLTVFPFTMVFDFLRALPVIALVPLVQMVAVDEWSKFALIAWAVTFPTWLAIRQSWLEQMIDTELALKASGLRKRDILRSYDLPKAFRGLLRGIEISIGIAWISVVAAEWIGNLRPGFWDGGLGYRVEYAHQSANWSGVLACLGLFGLLGVVSTFLWRTLVNRKLRLPRIWSIARHGN